MKKNKKKLLIANPYFETLGGGEKYVLSIGASLFNFGYEVHVTAQSNTFTNDCRDRFAITIPIKTHSRFFDTNFITRQHFLSGYDMVLYVTDGSYFFVPLNTSLFILGMYPLIDLYTPSLTNVLKWRKACFITFSHFSNHYISGWTGKKSEVVYPYIDEEIIELGASSKTNRSNIILSVGRFFDHLHSKNHIFLMNTFSKLQQFNNRFKKFKLIIVGGLKKEDNDYFNKVQKVAGLNSSIKLIPNCSREKLLSLYSTSMFYWHGAGYGVNEKMEPHKVEHFGITPLEAMASGCVVFSYNAGGQKEIVHSSVNGILYLNESELISATVELAYMDKIRQEIVREGKKTVRDRFSRGVFENRVREVFVS